MRNFGNGERTQRRAAELPGRVLQIFDGQAWLESDGLDRHRVLAGDRENLMPGVDGLLAAHVVGMQRNKGDRTAALDPAHWWNVVPLAPGHPGVVPVVVNPASRVADGPVIRTVLHQRSRNHGCLAGHRIFDRSIEKSRRCAGEVIIVDDCRSRNWSGGLRGLGWQSVRVVGRQLEVRLLIRWPARVLIPTLLILTLFVPIGVFVRLPAGSIGSAVKKLALSLHLRHARNRLGEPRGFHHRAGGGVALSNALGNPLVPRGESRVDGGFLFGPKLALLISPGAAGLDVIFRYAR